MTTWRVWTEDGGLAWADPGDEHVGLRSALEDCASTLSPVGGHPCLSTYWVDQLMTRIESGQSGELAHGNLWVLVRRGADVEVRMDVDDDTVPLIDVVSTDDLMAGMQALRDEVVRRRSEGHGLDDRRWSQQNP